MEKIAEIKKIKLPIKGRLCSVIGKFYYRISDSENTRNYSRCYLADSDDSDSIRIFLSDDIGEAVIDADETFGMMVGGEFAYYGLEAVLEGTLISSPQGLIFEKVLGLKLQKGGETQEFVF